jgi:hypothetical protein
MIANELIVDKDRLAVTKNVGKQKVCTEFVPHPLIMKMLAAKSVAELNHSLYSPDLAPDDLLLFPELKLKLKG